MEEVTARMPVTPSTRDEIRRLKTGTDRYEDVLRRLLDAAEEKD